MSFFEELQRRNVVRMAMLYVVASWVVLQVVDVIFDALEYPALYNRIVLAVLLVGFPIALIISWIYELTPEGLKRESEIDRDASTTQQTGRKMNFAIVGLLAVAIAMALLAAGRLLPDARPPGTQETVAAEELSIAVLPFANRSANSDDVYFVDGIHDDILTQLVRISSLTVTSRTSVERFRGTTLSIPEIAEQLGVGHILEGGIQRAGNRVRINLQLIDASRDGHVWAETYERELTAANVFDVQEDIARSVTTALRVTLKSEEAVALAARPTDSIEAYDLYLLGRFHWNKRTAESIELATEYFERATQVDPDFVLALSGLADSYTLSVDYGNRAGEEGYALAQAAIDRAMSLDDSVAEVWASLGLLRLQQNRNDESEAALERALNLDDKNFSAWNWYSSILSGQRRYQASLDALKAAYALEPMSIPVNSNLALRYQQKGDFVRARQHLERLGQLQPSSVADIEVAIAASYQAEGRLAAAVEQYRKVLSSVSYDFGAMAGLPLTYLLLGDMPEARRWFQRQVEANANAPSRIRLFEREGDFDATIVFLEDLMARVGSREPFLLAELFRASYLSGDIEKARSYLDERVAVLNADIKPEPWELNQYDVLLVAEFMMLHGDDPTRGGALLNEVYRALNVFYEEGFAHPDTLAGLALAESLRGNPRGGLDRLREAVGQGFRDLPYIMNHAAFEPMRAVAGFDDLVARVETAIEGEAARLASLELPALASDEIQPIELAQEVLRSYEGYFTDGNAVLWTRIREEDGSFVMSVGARGPVLELLPFEKDRFFAPKFRGGVIEFVRDEQDVITHVLMINGDTRGRMKAIPAPPEPISPPRELLERYQGVYAWKRPGTSGELESDYWVAEISVDEDNMVWLDFDDQPALQIVPYAEHQFYTPGFLARFEFVFESEGREATKMVQRVDGRVNEFLRR